MRVVVTNDDGIVSVGLDALALLCAARGWEVLVVAPSRDMSGSSAAIGHLSLTDDVHLLDAPRAVDGAAASHVVDGPPGLAALLACRGAIGPVPDLVLSGVNAGPNTGHSILHSGTVGAALTAASFGVSALAVSLEVGEPPRWDTATHFAGEALEILSASPRGTVLNLNVPSLAAPDVLGLRWARLDRFGIVRVAVGARRGTALQLEYRSTDLDLDPSSDTALLARGYATLTAIAGIGEIEPAEIGAQEDRPDGPDGRVTTLPPGAAPRGAAGRGTDDDDPG